jgi:hypothetical protein
VTSVGLLLQRTEHFPSPAELKEPCDQYLSVLQMAKNERLAQSSFPPVRSKPPVPQCTCLLSRRRQRPAPKSYWISIEPFRTESGAHSPNCPFAIPAQQSITTGFRIRACRGALGYLIEASLEWSYRSVSPRILSRNILPWNSLVFRLIHYCINSPSSSHQLMEALLKLLRDKKCSVLDVDPHGRTIAHVCG